MSDSQLVDLSEWFAWRPWDGCSLKWIMAVIAMAWNQQLGIIGINMDQRYDNPPRPHDTWMAGRPQPASRTKATSMSTVCTIGASRSPVVAADLSPCLIELRRNAHTHTNDHPILRVKCDQMNLKIPEAKVYQVVWIDLNSICSWNQVVWASLWHCW